MWAVRVSFNGYVSFASSGGEFELEQRHRPNMRISELWLPFKSKFSGFWLETIEHVFHPSILYKIRTRAVNGKQGYFRDSLYFSSYSINNKYNLMAQWRRIGSLEISP